MSQGNSREVLKIPTQEKPRCVGHPSYVGKETDRKWEEGDDISVLEFKSTEYGRTTRVVASEEVKKAIRDIGINKCARESGFDRKNFVRKLDRDIPVKRNSYERFVRWLESYKSQNANNGQDSLVHSS
jgi:hypothetical protein